MLPSLVNRAVWCAWMFASAAAAAAPVPGGDVILAENARVKLTRADFDAELVRRVPAPYRAEFASSPERLTNLLNQLLIRKTLAAEAREAGLDREPIPQQSDADAVLAQRFVDTMDAAARADFDRRIDAFTAKAREDYLVFRQRYVTKEQIEVSQLFVEAVQRGDAAALELAKTARAELAKGADIARLARDFPDEPPTGFKLARGTWIARDDVDATLGNLLFDMNGVGDVTGPFRTRSGYYLFRLEGKRPSRPQTFDEVKDQILEELRRSHVEAMRTAKNEAIVMDPKLIVNQPAVEALVSGTDREAVRKALQSVPSKPPPN